LTSSNYILWLQLKISILNPYVIYSFVFGSVAKYSSSPNDCDLMIVTSLSPKNEEWKTIRKKKDLLCKLFINKFSLPLSAMMLTVEEYTEEIPFLKRILRRPRIDIFGGDFETPNNTLNKDRLISRRIDF
jgi:hypothetical protein